MENENETNYTPPRPDLDNEMECFIDPPTIPKFDEDDGDPVAEPMEDPLITRLRQAFSDYITPRLKSVGSPADMIEPYVEEKLRWFITGVEKFRRGQEEHGGDIRERDMDHEMDQEIMDLIEYAITKRLQRKYLRIYVPN